MNTFYESSADFTAALKKVEKHSKMKLFQSTIRLHLVKGIPTSHYYLYSQEGDDFEYWIGINVWSKVCHIQVGRSGKFSEKAFQSFFTFVFKEKRGIDELCDALYMNCNGDPLCVAAIEKFANSIGIETPRHTRCWMYAFHRSINIPKYHLPEGFTVDSIQEKDVGLVARTWIFKSPTEEERIRLRLKNLETVCIRATNGDAAAFIMLESNGMIVHAFVLEEYRGKRLRDALFFVLAQNARDRFGIEPYFCTVKPNLLMDRWVKDEWKVLDEDGEHESMDFLPLTIDNEAIERIQSF
ncbi:unnamed protein product, partial [Mesorhabditis belari]|uniref:Glycine N-acyltransferase-like protein n=1 Tax=Mesorhabditis belari TaxID=2138241 RepID=A0AAF3EVP2_9BILA